MRYEFFCDEEKDQTRPDVPGKVSITLSTKQCSFGEEGCIMRFILFGNPCLPSVSSAVVVKVVSSISSGC